MKLNTKLVALLTLGCSLLTAVGTAAAEEYVLYLRFAGNGAGEALFKTYPDDYPTSSELVFGCDSSFNPDEPGSICNRFQLGYFLYAVEVTANSDSVVSDIGLDNCVPLGEEGLTQACRWSSPPKPGFPPITALFTINKRLQSNSNFAGHDFSGQKLSKVNFSGSDFTNAKLVGAVLKNVDLTNSKLSGANLTNADLSNADLSGADLTGAILKDANLSAANLTGTILDGVDLTGANLTGVDLMNTMYQVAITVGPGATSGSSCNIYAVRCDAAGNRFLGSASGSHAANDVFKIHLAADSGTCFSNGFLALDILSDCSDPIEITEVDWGSPTTTYTEFSGDGATNNPFDPPVDTFWLRNLNSTEGKGSCVEHTFYPGQSIDDCTTAAQ